jgi:hypothetical protein
MTTKEQATTRAKATTTTTAKADTTATAKTNAGFFAALRMTSVGGMTGGGALAEFVSGVS